MIVTDEVAMNSHQPSGCRATSCRAAKLPRSGLVWFIEPPHLATRTLEASWLSVPWVPCTPSDVNICELLRFLDGKDPSPAEAQRSPSNLPVKTGAPLLKDQAALQIARAAVEPLVCFLGNRFAGQGTAGPRMQNHQKTHGIMIGRNFMLLRSIKPSS